MILRLKSRSLLYIGGEDAKSFLQGQLSNDIDAISDGGLQINAYCQHQGKVIAILWVLIVNGEIYISLPIELAELVKNRLQIFVMMSDVVIHDVTIDIPQYGIIDEEFEKSYKLNDRQSIYLGEIQKKEICYENENPWEQVCIDTEIPEVYLDTTEKFVPQALNLDIDELGVSFSKGCYPGQEVVARLHYLGKAKRRMHKFNCEYISPGDDLLVSNSKSLRPSGKVVRSAKLNNEFYCLASIEIEYKNDKICDHNENTLVRIKNE
jgi:hypothetical protein